MKKNYLLSAMIAGTLFTCMNANLYAQEWHIKGNSGTDPVKHFVGTKDSVDLIFRTNNIERLRMLAATGGLLVADPGKSYILSGKKTGKGIAVDIICSNSNNIDPAISATNAGSGSGIFGSSVNGFGVHGKGYYGVHAEGTAYGLYATGTSSGYGIYTTGAAYGTVSYGSAYGVYGQGASYGSYSSATGTGSVGAYGYSSGSSGYGVYGESYYGVRGNGTYGVWGNSSNGGYGVYGSSNYLGVWGNGDSYGVYGTGGTYGAYFSATSYGSYNTGAIGAYGYSSTTGGDGLHGQATGTAGYGLYGYSSSSFGLYAGTSTGSYAGYFSGNVYCTGTYYGSDAKLKKNIKDMDNALDIINKLKPKNYEYREDGNFAKMNLPKGNHYGLIAQDVEKVLPNLVKETSFDAQRSEPDAAIASLIPDTTGKKQETAKERKIKSGDIVDFKAVNYTELIPVMIKAIQELSKQNEELREQLNNMSASTAKTVDNIAKLSDAAMVQNVPNPFNGSTTINYTLPQKFSAAQIRITDNNGNVLKQVNLSGQGKGSVRIDAATLSAGTYNYSFIVDGKTIETKQMILVK